MLVGNVNNNKGTFTYTATTILTLTQTCGWDRTINAWIAGGQTRASGYTLSGNTLTIEGPGTFRKVN
jgi:hypothetical protein